VFLHKLTEIISPYKGGNCPITLNYTSNVAKANLQLGDEWRIHPTDDLITRLRWFLGQDKLEVRYK